MKLPHKIRIKAKCAYQIVWVDRFDDENCRGLCDSGNKHIYLLKGMSDSLALETLFHEMLHAVELEYEFAIPHKAIYGLEQALHKLLKLNGWMPKG